MKFYPRRRRQAPAIIIISLIDVLIVLVVFLLVTTNFKNQPAVKISLPESQQAARQNLVVGANEEMLVVTIRREQPNFYVGMRPVTGDSLVAELSAAVKTNPNVGVELNADEGAGVGLVFKVWDAAKVAKVKNIKIRTKTAKK